MKVLLISLIVILFSSCQFPPAEKEDKTYVAITFDDGFQDIYDNALPIMSHYGIRATNFINTGIIGQTHYLTWDQVEDLEFVYGWETGGHTLHHVNLPDCSLEEARVEIGEDWANLNSRGLSHKTFAIPNGAATPEDYEIILNYYNNIRNSHEPKLFYPIDRTNIGYFAYITSFTAKDVIARILKGISNKECLVVIGFHRVMEEDGNNPYNCKPIELSGIMEFINSENIEVVTIQEAAQKLSY